MVQVRSRASSFLQETETIILIQGSARSAVYPNSRDNGPRIDRDFEPKAGRAAGYRETLILQSLVWRDLDAFSDDTLACSVERTRP